MVHEGARRRGFSRCGFFWPLAHCEGWVTTNSKIHPTHSQYGWFLRIVTIFLVTEWFSMEIYQWLVDQIIKIPTTYQKSPLLWMRGHHHHLFGLNQSSCSLESFLSPRAAAPSTRACAPCSRGGASPPWSSPSGGCTAETSDTACSHRTISATSV